MTRLDWDRARRRPVAGPRAPRQRGISNDQARELAQLQKALGLPYTGSGMSAMAAAALIADLRRRTA